MSGILHSWPIEIDFNRAQIRSRIRETDIMDLKSVASYIVFKDGDKYYAKNGSTGMVEYSDTDATKVIQYAIDKIKALGGGVLALRPGTYYIKPQFTYHLQDRSYSVGLSTDGANGLIIEGNGAKLIADVGTEIILYVLNTSNSIIRNLILDGNKGVQTWTYADGKALLLAGGVRYNNRYENITVMNARGDGIYFGNHKPDEYGGGEQPEYNAVIRNIVSYNNADVGQGGVILDACVNTIAENIISYNDRVGLHISSPPNHPYPLIIKGVQILDAKYIGITDYYGNAELYDVAMYASASQYFDEAFIKFTFPNARIKIEGLYIDASKVALGNSESSTSYYPVWVIVSTSGNPLELTIRNAYVKTPTKGIYIAFRIFDNVKAHLENIKIVATYGFTIGGSTYTSSAVINNADVSGVTSESFNILNSTTYIYNVLTTSFKVYARSDALAVFDKPYPNMQPGADIRGLKFLRNSGVATISAGSTRITVNHNLISTPTKILLTPGGNARVWYENITSTSFDIVTDTAPSAALNVSWYAEV